jgi:hypothetical protein
MYNHEFDWNLLWMEKDSILFSHRIRNAISVFMDIM